MSLVRIFILLGVSLLAGCGGPPWVIESQDQIVPQPPSDKAQVVFLLPSSGLASLFITNVFEVTGTEKRHIGMMGSTNKLFTNIKPGKTQFFCLTGQMGHVLDANLQAGKRYYVILRYIHGGNAK